MATVTLDAYSKGYPAITNRIKASVLSATSPYAVVASIIDVTVGHPQRVYSFPGLPRNNYGFSLDEIDGGGAVVNNLALFSVVPSSIDGLLTRADEQIQVDVTVGLVSGTASFVFDGTAGKPDYLGWDIIPTEQAGGRGLMVEGVDYSWDPVTATFNLLQLDDVFNNAQYYNIHFEPQQQTAGGSYPTVTDFVINFLDVDTTLDDTYFGKMLIIEPTGIYTEITLPAIATVPDGRKMMVNTRGAGFAAIKFLTQGADTINFLNGTLIAMLNEEFSIYVFDHPVNGREYRVCDIDGNFKSVGQSVADDGIAADVWNRKLLDGSSLDKYQYARLYEFVENLPLAQVVDYDSHATGNNKYLWGRANSANPANANKFLVPDRRNLFERNNQSGKAGDYQAEMIKATGTNITLPYVQNNAAGATFGITDGPNYGTPPQTIACTFGTGTETRPVNYLINKYVLV